MEICAAGDSHTVLVAENPAGTVVGYVAVHWLPYPVLTGFEGHISELFVLESERGRGIGRRLLEAVKKKAIERGCVSLELLTGRNSVSYERGFYRNLDWKELTEIADFILPLLWTKWNLEWQTGTILIEA